MGGHCIILFPCIAAPWYGYPTRGVYMLGSGSLPLAGSGLVSVAAPLPGLTTSYGGYDPRAFMFENASSLWLADGSNTYGVGGLWHFVLQPSTGNWVRGGSSVPYWPPSSAGVVEMAGRVEAGVLKLYARTSGATQAFNFVFDTQSRTWRALSLPTPLPDTHYKSSILAPCDPAINGPCDGSNIAPSASSSPAATASPSSSVSPSNLFARSSVLALRFVIVPGQSQSATSALWIDEVNAASGAVVRSIPLPTTPSADGVQRACTLDPAFSPGRGQLSLSQDGSVALLGCYDAPANTLNPATITGNSAPYRRVIARIDAAGYVDTSLFLQWSPFSTSLREGIGGVAADASGNLWVTGTDSYASARLRFIPATGTKPSQGGASDRQVTSAYGWFARPVLSGGRLLVSLQTPYAGPNYGIQLVGGSGAPTGATAGTDSAVTAIPGQASGYRSVQPTGFVFEASNKLWIADATPGYGSGGIFLLVRDPVTQQWSSGDVFSPWLPPNRAPLIDISGRVEPSSGVYTLYVMTSTGAAFAFDTVAKAFTNTTAFLVSTSTATYRSVIPVPCASGSSCPVLTSVPGSPPPTPAPAAFTPGSFLALRLGNGSGPLPPNLAAPLYLDEVDPFSGRIVQSISVPFSPSGSDRACLLDPSLPATQLHLSSDRRYVHFGCYAGQMGASYVASIPSNGPSSPRVIARVGTDGSVSVSTALSWTPFSNVFLESIGAVVTTGAVGSPGLWVAGSDSYNDGRIRFVPYGNAGDVAGAGTDVQIVRLQDTPMGSGRLVDIATSNGTLFVLVRAPWCGHPTRGVFSVTTSDGVTPPTNGSLPVIATLLPGISQSYAFCDSRAMAFSPDGRWLYVTDGSTSWGSGGLYIFSANSSGYWSLVDSPEPFPGATGAGVMDGRMENGVFVLYVSRYDSSVFSQRFNTATRQWTAIPAMVPVIADTVYRGSVLVPCDPSISGSACDGSDVLPSTSSTPSPTPSSSPSPSTGSISFSPASLIVLRIGNGSAVFSGTAVAAPLFLDELTPQTGAVIRSIPLPTAAATVNGLTHYACTLPAAPTPGALSRSADGQYIHLPCLDAPVGAPSPFSQPSYGPAYKRVIAVISADGRVDTSTLLPWSPFSTTGTYGVYSVASVGGGGAVGDRSGQWVSTYESYGQRLVYVAPGASSASPLTVVTNLDWGIGPVRLYRGQLFAHVSATGSL